MTKPLQAWATFLHWQLQHLSAQQQQLAGRLGELEVCYQQQEQQLVKACATPRFILPECEIARCHFIRQKHDQMEQLHVKQVALQADIGQLVARKIAVKRQLKRCEQQHVKRLNQRQHQANLLAQSKLDEWVLQQQGRI